jgi:hypothetical protein
MTMPESVARSDPPFFSLPVLGASGAQNRKGKKRNHSASATQGGAALALGCYVIVLTGLRFASLRSDRFSNRFSQLTGGITTRGECVPQMNIFFFT